MIDPSECEYWNSVLGVCDVGCSCFDEECMEILKNDGKKIV